MKFSSQFWVLVVLISFLYCVVQPFIANARHVTTLRPKQNGRHFADDIFQSLFLNKTYYLGSFPLKFVTKGPIDNKSTLVQVMAWSRTNNKPLFELMMASFTDAYTPHSISKSQMQYWEIWIRNCLMCHILPTRNQVTQLAERHERQSLSGLCSQHDSCRLPGDARSAAVVMFAYCTWNNWPQAQQGMMTSSNRNNFRVIGHFRGEFIGRRWIPHTKASDAELWCFLWSAPE